MSHPQPTATRLIGYYKKKNSQEGVDITDQEFFDGVATGKWKRNQDWVRQAIGDDKEYDRRKQESPCVTIAGTFNGPKTKENLREPSGLMAVDLDALLERVESFRQLLSQDPYVYAVFKSIGGRGLCPIFRIDPARWDESFAGISDYLITTYGLVGKQFDPSSSNINRLRYVSYDPDIYVNDKAKLFAKYPRKERKQPKPQAFVHTQKDIQHIIDQIDARSLDLTGSYYDWYRIGWALISEYGEEARDLFQQVSQYHPEYDADECDKKFRYLVATRPAQIRIATFYWYCKQAGLDIMTPRTKEIVSVAAMGKKQKISQASTVEMVGKQLGVPAAEAAPIVEQVYASSEAIDTQETIFDQLELFLRTNYELRYNEVTHVFEDQRGREQEEADFYAMYISARKVVSDKLRFADFQMLIFSHTIFPKVHPIKDFFAQHSHRRPTGVIDQLIASIETDTGFTDAHFSPRFSGNYIRKWLIGLIETLYGNPCAIALFLTGAPNSGKTSWFRQLLPAELAAYRYETKWADNRDEYVRMCTHWLSFYDEFRTGDATSVEHFKNLTTKDYFTVRLPFGKKDVRLQRLAVLCATSNSKNVINEPEFNRRVIPINVLRVDWAIYNAIDRIDLLMEAYHAYQAGERSTLTTEEIVDLRELTEEFQNKSLEQQLVDQYLVVPTGQGGETIQYLATTEIMSWLELRVNNRKLVLNNVGSALRAAGFERKSKKVPGRTKPIQAYAVVVLD